MIDQLIHNISNAGIQDFFRQKIPSFRPEEEELRIEKGQGYEEFSDFIKLGSAKFSDEDELLVFSCQYQGELTQRSSKKKQFEIAKSALKEDFKDGAIFIFYDEEGRFRFSFIRRNYGDQDEKYTPWRRYTYFVQPGLPNKTFRNRIGNCEFTTLDEIQNAFSVEPLSKEFYKRLSHWYFYALDHVEFPNDRNEDEYTVKANGLIRLITRIIFVWFMKQNRLVPEALFDKDQVDQLINDQDATGSIYYKAILQNLFFATLNTPPKKPRKFVNRQHGVQGFYRYKRFIEDEEQFLELMKDIPFLNGGLFENLDQATDNTEEEIRVDCFSDRKVNEERLKVPDYLFFGNQKANLEDYLGKKHQDVEVTGLIDLLNRYDFTIDENTPYDQEVALDPELLGLVFENLLASYNPETEATARKESGSFYTPREVVDFMVEESLLEHLVQQTQLNRESLKTLFKNNDEQPFEKQEDKEAIVNALSNLKLIDPACGSGAFPMGALQKMVHVLALVDHDNQMWKERQKAIAIEETKEAYEIGDHEERKQRLDAIEQAFEEGVKEPDYARKLYLIENTMYGVDIQPIAIQIAKLRFFIALLVDQETEPDRENFGIMALPNLETKFVAADVLKPLPAQRDQDRIAWDFVQPNQKELNQVRHELFNARTSRTKDKKRQRHIEIQEEIRRVLKEKGFPNEMAEAIKNWQAFDPNACADWFDPEWMFGLEKFDVVIGNPPYIKEYTYRTAFDGFRNSPYYQGKMDIWYGFACIGIDLLKEGGVISFIAQNNWITSSGASILRDKVLEETEIKTFIDFHDCKVFETPTIQTMIFLLKKKTPSNEYQINYGQVHKKTLNPNELAHFLNSAFKTAEGEKYQIPFKPSSYEGKTISFNKPHIEDLLNKISLSGNRYLREKEVTQGIVPNPDKVNNRNISKLNRKDISLGDGVFVVDKGFFKNLPDQEKKYLKPLFDPYLVERYSYSKNDKEIIYITKQSYEGDAPLLLEHLSKFKPIMNERRENQNGKLEFYHLHWPRNKHYFDEGAKIVSVRKCNQPTFTYTEAEFYGMMSFNIVKSNKLDLKYLTGLLNSKLISFWLWYKGKLQGSNFQIDKEPLKEIPLRIPQNTEPVAKLVDTILNKKANDQDTEFEEHQIDLMVYKFYELTYDEVLVVDPETPFRREDFEQGQIEAI